MAKSRKHPRHEEVYTPVTPELIALLWRIHDELGSWRKVCLIAQMRPKTLRHIRTERRKSVSFTWLDTLCILTGVGSVDEFEWFTADDLVALGIWKPTQYVHGKKRIKGDKVWVSEKLGTGKKKERKPKVKPQGNQFIGPDGRPTEAFRKEQLKRRRPRK